MFVFTTSGDTLKAEMKWIIRNFAFDWSSKKVGEKMVSPLFHAEEDEEVQWCVSLYPNGEKKEFEGFVSLFLKLLAMPPSQSNIPSKFSFSIVDEMEGKLLSQKEQLSPSLFISQGGPSTLLTTQAHQSTGFSMACKADFLKYQAISIICKVEYGNWKPTTTSIVQNHLSSSFNGLNQTPSLNQDLEELFTSRLGADVCFIIDGQEVRAHKAILIARSPVFAAMLNSGMKESVLNRVEVQDVAMGTFEALLRFVYTDQVDLDKIDTKDLLAAANRYILLRLKFRCEEFLSTSLTTENCTEIFMHAEIHNAALLKKASESFIRARHTQIMRTEGWNQLKLCRPDLAIEIFEGLH